MTTQPIVRQHRALEWLALYGRRYPWAWELYAKVLADPPTDWPSWCFCPLAGAYAVLSRGGTCTTEQAADIGVVGAFAAWRATKGIFRFHPTLLRDLVETPVSGDLPADVLKRLPAWCVYVETPQRTLWGMQLHGFWAYLEHDANDLRDELRLVLDLADTLEQRMRPGQCVIHLGGTLEDGLRAAVREARVQALRAGHPETAPSLAGIARIDEELGGLISLLLYLCADDAEIEERQPLPPPVVYGKKRPICPSAKLPTVHPCGYRIGSALDLARGRLGHESGEGQGPSVTPHVRRAHWHRYWTGPRGGERRVALRWLSPILVGFDDVAQHATVRPVRLS